MNRSEKLFTLIDKAFNPSQNKKKFPDITKEENICYWEKYKEDCLADFYFDEKIKTPFPVFINIHGGGFVKGDKKYRSSISGHFASQGFFVVNINYRLSPKYVFPAVAEDLVELLDFLPTIAEKYNLDLNKVVVSGDSAGAYYSAVAVALSYNEEYRQALNLREPKIKVTALVSFCGPFNLLLAIKKKMPFDLTRNIGESFTGLQLDKKMSNINDYKYLKFLNPTDFLDNINIPIFIVYAKKDIFCKGHAEDWINRLKKKNYKFKEYSSTELLQNHCFHLTLLNKKSIECLNSVNEFLKEIK